MLSAGVWVREERAHWSRNKRNNRKTGPLKQKVEGGRTFRTMESLRILGAKTQRARDDLCISVTGYNLHVEQITPAAFEIPEPVGCHGEGTQNCPIISQS